jgi:hypothetical protein
VPACGSDLGLLEQIEQLRGENAELRYDVAALRDARSPRKNDHEEKYVSPAQLWDDLNAYPRHFLRPLSTPMTRIPNMSIHCLVLNFRSRWSGYERRGGGGLQRMSRTQKRKPPLHSV